MALEATDCRSNHIYPLQPKMPRRRQHVAVVGIDFLEALLGGGGEVEGIGRSEENGCGQLTDFFNRRFNQARRDWIECPSARFTILFELFSIGVVNGFADGSLAQFPVEHGSHFHPD